MRGPAARGGPRGKGRQATRLGFESTAPRAHLHELVLVEAKRVGRLGRFILLFSIPPDTTSQRQPRARGRKKTLCVPTRQPQPEPVAPAESATSANMAAAAPRPISEGSAGRLPPAAAKRDVGKRRCHRAVGHAASMRRRAALQLRQAGLGSLARSEVGLRMKSTGWRSLGLPLQPPFLLGKIYLQHSSRNSSLILPQGLAQIQVGGRKNFGSSLLREPL